MTANGTSPECQLVGIDMVGVNVLFHYVLEWIMVTSPF